MGMRGTAGPVLTSQEASGLCATDSYFWKMGTEASSSLLTMCWGTERQAKTGGAWDRHNDPFRMNSFRMGLAALTVTY